MSVLLLTHRACLGHDPGPYHPECPDRLRAVLAALDAEE
ncbi:MAG: histone deacetylase family protein, partial [Pseudomonadota bacterium]